MNKTGGLRAGLARALRWLWRPSSRLPTIVLLLAGGIVALGGWGAFNGFLGYTNTLEFCIGCHEMEQTVYREYQGTVHAKNPSGVQATCPDCHVPKDFGRKMVRKVQALSEIYHKIAGTIDTPEKFEERRAYLAEKVWAGMRATDSAECRTCHSYAIMKFPDQRPRAQERHPEAIKDGKTCIDCHRGIAHRLPPRDD